MTNPTTTKSPVELAAGAAWVLGGNDIGTMVTAAPRLYPHMWSWDAAFVMIGLAHLDIDRAARELEYLLRAQWRNGMLPHIVFSEDTDYFPGPDRWGANELAPDAPRSPRTSGICQPPVHAIALLRILEVARAGSQADADRAEQLLKDSWEPLYRWHSWPASYREPDGCGLLAIVHGWESGMDNSPRWDVPYSGVVPKPEQLPPYTRRDRSVLGDDSQRPSDAEYDRYLWLIEEMRGVNYQPDRMVHSGSFLVADVFISAVFALACDVLAELGEQCGQSVERIAQLRDLADRSRTAVAGSCAGPGELARDRDLRTGSWLDTRTVAGFSPLLCGGLDVDVERQLQARIDGPDWAGHPGLLAAVPPSVAVTDPGFRPREYWRGPQWPVVAWLFSWAYQRRGWYNRAAKLREAGLRLVGDGAFAEYYEPLTGEPLGSTRQSWTAAVTLDWLHR